MAITAQALSPRRTESNSKLIKEIGSIKKTVVNIEKFLSSNKTTKKIEAKILKIPTRSLDNKKDKINSPINTKNFGIRDSINRFLFFMFLGKVFPLVTQYASKFKIVSSVFSEVFKFSSIFTGNFFKGLVNTIEFGYKVADKTKNLLNQITKFKYVKQFDDIESGLKTFINGAIIAGGILATAGFIPKNLVKNPFKFNLKNIAKGVTSKGFRMRALNVLSKGKFGKVFSRIPILGGLIDFIISIASGESVGRSAAKAVGASLGAALGTLIPIPIAGSILGGILGDVVGGAVYDTVTSYFSKPKIKKHKSGGIITRNGVPINTKIRRTISPKISKKLQIKKLAQTKTYAGKDVGGETKISKLFNDDKDLSKRSALRSLKTTSKLLKTIPMFGGLMGASVDIAMGQKPDPNVYKTFIDNFNALIQNHSNEETVKSVSNIRTSIMSMASGGIVPRTLAVTPKINPENLGQVISSTFSTILNQKSQEIFQSIIKEISLKSPIMNPQGGDLPEFNESGGQYETEPGIQKDIYDYLISKGLSDIHALGIMANIFRESTFRISIVNEIGAAGLFQWLNDRRTKMTAAVPNWTTNWKGQIDYALKEDYGPKYLKNKYSSPQEAADDWMRRWERPEKIVQTSTGPKVHREYLSKILSKLKNGGLESKITNIDKKTLDKLGFGIGEGLGVDRGAGRKHGGRDIRIAEGTPIRALSDGQIVDSGIEQPRGTGWGEFIVFKDNKGIYHLFAHLSRRGRVGRVKKGDVIANTGSTGHSTGPHLHWEAGTGWNGRIQNRFEPLDRYSAYSPFLTKSDSESKPETKNVGGTIYKKLQNGKWQSDSSSPEIISDEDMRIRLKEQEKNRLKSYANPNTSSDKIAKYTTYNLPEDKIILARQMIFIETPVMI